MALNKQDLQRDLQELCSKYRITSLEFTIGDYRGVYNIENPLFTKEDKRDHTAHAIDRLRGSTVKELQDIIQALGRAELGLLDDSGCRDVAIYSDKP